MGSFKKKNFFYIWTVGQYCHGLRRHSSYEFPDFSKHVLDLEKLLLYEHLTLKCLNLYSLEKRRLRGQLIETFKMFKGLNTIDYRHLFTFSNNLTRSNGWKLKLKRFNTSQCGNFFTYKNAPVWNRLPAGVVNSASVEQFKIKLDKVIDTLIRFFFFSLSLLF